MAETTHPKSLRKQLYNIVLLCNFATTERFPQRYNIGKCITDLYL